MSTWSNTVHPDEGEWRAYLDGELPPERIVYLDRHRRNCAQCQRRFQEVQATAAIVAGKLGALRAMAEVSPVPPMPAKFHPVRKEESHMVPFRLSPRAAAAVAAAALGCSLLIPSVRAAAAEWMGIFRIQEARVVQLDPADFQNAASKFNLANLNPSALKNLIQYEQVKSAKLQEQMSLEEVEYRGFKAPTYLPAGYQPGREGHWQAETEQLIRIDVDGVNALLSTTGSSAQLPAELKGQAVRVQMGAVYGFTYHNGEKELQVLQGKTPVISASGQVDVNKLMETLTGVLGDQLGLPTNIRSQLRSIDLTKTLPLPVAKDAGEEIQVQGHTGAFYPGEERQTVVWVADGRICAVSGDLDKAELLRIAESIGE